MTKLAKKNVKNPKKIINSGKALKIAEGEIGHVDEKRYFHRKFRSYSQVIPIVWKTCEMYVETRLISCGKSKKQRIIHRGGIF